MDQLRALRVFVRVIAEGSFAGAARALDLAPAVVTRSVAELEQHLGARLLNRSTRRIALTEIGEAYLARARRILADLEDADALAGASTRQPRGSLRVLCPPAFAVHQLARHLPAFRARYPQLGLELSTPGPVPARRGTPRCHQSARGTPAPGTARRLRGGAAERPGSERGRPLPRR